MRRKAGFATGTRGNVEGAKMHGSRGYLATISLSVALVACSVPPARSGPSSYLATPSSTRIDVWDSGDRLAFRYSGDENRHDGDGPPEGAVRCGYIARNTICVIVNPTVGQREYTSDGGVVVASLLTEGNWRFLYRPVRSGDDDCGYAIWSPRRGVMEFGPTACLGTSSPSTVWRLVEGRGFF